ncbi:MAG: hypothetical protein EOM64_01605 [Erysipelotrichia bacterium]|nr:hypothetical protein [Erysipelotrichia bacterium]
MRISEVIKKLEEWHQPFEREHTRDAVKCGDPDQECTGIAVTCYGSAEVIQKAAEKGCNLLISHESIFFGDEFDVNGFIDNETLKKKQKLIRNTGMVVYRDHDHMHGMGGGPHQETRIRNDYIFYGIMKELGWEEFAMGDKMKPLLYKLPKTTVRELSNYLIEKLNLNGIRMIGRWDDEVSTVYIVEHCMGRGDQDKINKAVHADVMIPLEICDWTLSAYVRDAVTFHEAKAILEMGHFNFEEPGMKYMTEWLPEAIGSADLPIVFIQAGDAFHYMNKEMEEN